MLRTLFLFSWIIFALGAEAYGGIEIYVNGHKFTSIQAYAQWERSRTKTILVNPKIPIDQVQHKLYVLSIESGIARALKEFYQPHDFSMFRRLEIYPQQLQRAIQQAVTASTTPKLLIVESGKIRILDLR